jgi:hypothetical protein
MVEGSRSHLFYEDATRQKYRNQSRGNLKTIAEGLVDRYSFEYFIMQLPPHLSHKRKVGARLTDVSMRKLRAMSATDTFNRLSVVALVLAVLILLFSVELYMFATAQDVWTDETTQLSGITLPALEMIRWLSGDDLGRFSVPGDRMPPVSYLLDWSWLRLEGASILSFRLFHSAFVVAGALTIAVVARMHVGRLASIVTFAFLVLSPKLIRTGVEIRAYPIFFAATCAQIALFLTLFPKASASDPDSRIDLKRLTLFAATCLIAIYTHFYGVVSTAAFFFALACVFMRSSKSMIALFITGGILALASVGLLPFITSAVDMSSAGAAKEKSIDQYISFLLRIFGDSANMVLVPAAISFIAGTIVLLLAGAVAAFGRIIRQKARPIDWLFIVVIAGAVIPMLASIGIKRFDTLKPDYSDWLLPLLAVLVGSGASSRAGIRLWDWAGRFTAIGLTIVGASASTLLFLDKPSLFIHGPQRFVGGLYDHAIEPKAIVYESEASWPSSYFPLVFSHRNKIIQFRALDDGSRVLRIGSDAASDQAPQDSETALAPYKHLIVVDIRLRNYRDIRVCQDANGACQPMSGGDIVRTLIQTRRWTVANHQRQFGIYDTQVTDVRRRADADLPTVPRK